MLDDGFAIYVLTNDGKLHDLKENIIPDNYHLDLNQFNSKRIYEIACQQLKVNQEKIGILDYRNSQRFLQFLRIGEDANVFSWGDFEDHPEELEQIIGSVKSEDNRLIPGVPRKYLLNPPRVAQYFNAMCVRLFDESYLGHD